MRLKGKHLVLVALLLLAVTGPAALCHAETDKAVPSFRTTDLPLPRFVSLRSDKVYVRAGPDMRYPIKWVYKRSHMPVEIIQEYESWRKIKDRDGEEGWIHQSLLSGERTVLIKDTSDDLFLHEEGSATSRPVARIEPLVVAKVDKCSNDWCKVEAGSYRGWIERNLLWGIYEDEELN